MPKGWCPECLYNRTDLDKEHSMADIYNQIQCYSGEFFKDDDLFFRTQTDFMVPLPPLYYEGKFVKGMFLSQGVDYIHSLFPRINEIFFSMAYTMWSSIPYSDKAEVYLTSYNNPDRENWFKSLYPDRKDKIFIPLHDGDYTHEYLVAPVFAVEKDIDILCVSRLSKVKNLDILLKALMLYHKKYNIKLKATLLAGMKEEDLKSSKNEVVKQLEKIAGSREVLNNYIEIIGHVDYGVNLNTYYTRSRLLVLTSIYEAKNRALAEANLCNTPVLVFKDLNKWTRGVDETLIPGCGMYVPEFSVESLCDTMHEALMNLDSFKPRRNYLSKYGRKNFINKCIDSISYYRENLPEYQEGRIQDNMWVDLAMQDNYQISFDSFLYDMNPLISRSKLHEKHTDIMDFYSARFGINK